MKYTADQELRALSWRQPYGELMLYGKIETRTWSTKYLGWVLICTSIKDYPIDEVQRISGQKQFFRIVDGLSERILAKGRPSYSGYAIAIGRLVDCRPMTLEDEDACFVQYKPGLFCHVYEDVQAIQAIPWKGSQGWKMVSDDVKNQIRLLAT